MLFVRADRITPANFQLWRYGAGRRRGLRPRGCPLFDGNPAEEVALARAQWKELKDLGFALTYWQQGANGPWENEILSQRQKIKLAGQFKFRLVTRSGHFS